MLDIILIFLAAAGVALVLWCLLGLLLQPVFGRNMVTLCFARGDGRELEYRVRAYSWLREGRISGGRLALVDCGLTAHGRQVAELLCARYAWLDYCALAELSTYLDGVNPPGQVAK